ncbi:hypothetical protein IC582_002694 [Cucumis melo]
MPQFLCRFMKIDTWRAGAIAKFVNASKRSAVHCFSTAAASLSNCYCSAQHLRAPNLQILHSILLPCTMSVLFICSGVAIVCSLFIALLFFNLAMLGWFNCCCRSPEMTDVKNIKYEDSNLIKISTIMYKKENKSEETNIPSECALCLSPCEDGECIRKLLACNLVFHASCIDVWLYSHSNCPLCRTTLDHVACNNGELTSGVVNSHVVVINNSLQIGLSLHESRRGSPSENMV